MGRTEKNVVMHGASGKVGDLLQFSQRFGKTYFGKIANRTGVATAAQLAVREKFRKAIIYAKSSLADTMLVELYKSKAEGDFKPFNAAIRDYFTPPKLEQITTDQYDGSIGSKIYMVVYDDTAVKTVQVSILAADGSTVETGPAIAQPNTNLWFYEATVTNSSPAGCKVKVVANDHPGNETAAEQLL